MNAFRAALVLLTAGLLAACDSSAPPAHPAPPAATPTVRTEPAPVAPVPTTAVQTPAPQATPGAPQPAPSSQRPLSQRELAAMEPLFGVWAADLRSCDAGAIEISQTRFEGAESGCDITSLVDSGGWNFVATLSCQSQGQTVRERIGMVPLYSPTGEAIGLTYLDRGNQAVTVYRCD